jgi:hypothetical protein
MPARRTARIAVTAAALVATALMTAGVTYAATSASTPDVVKACVSSKGLLSLASAKGKCAQGSSAVSINERGRTGATGKTGKQGPKGDPGIAAPTPISIGLDSSDTATSSKTFDIGSTGMTVQGTCLTRGDATALTLTGSSAYYVHGSAQYLNNGANLDAQTVLASGNQAVASGASLIYFESDATSTIEVYVPKPTVNSTGNAQLYEDLIVLTGGRSFSIRLYEYFDGGHCQLSAQVIAP